MYGWLAGWLAACNRHGETFDHLVRFSFLHEALLQTNTDDCWKKMLLADV